MKSIGLIVWAPCAPEPDFMEIHPMVVVWTTLFQQQYLSLESQRPAQQLLLPPLQTSHTSGGRGV